MNSKRPEAAAPLDTPTSVVVQPASQAIAASHDDTDLPVVARLVVEVRSDGKRTIARGGMEDLALGKRVTIDARGDSPFALAMQLTRALVQLPGITAARAVQQLAAARPLTQPPGARPPVADVATATATASEAPEAKHAHAATRAPYAPNEPSASTAARVVQTVTQKVQSVASATQSVVAAAQSVAATVRTVHGLRAQLPPLREILREKRKPSKR